MARYTLGLVTGAAIMLIVGAAAGIHAQADDVTEAAAAAGLPRQEVAAAIDSQPGVNVWQYLRWEGKLAPLPSPKLEVLTGTVWDTLAMCESTSTWNANTGNGYYGGIQFDLPTWRAYGGLAYAARPDLASRAAQIAVAEKLRAVRGFQPWPVCSRRLGLR